MRKISVDWDTDNKVIKGLPTEIEIPDNIENDEVADYLSDKYGWCVYSWVEL